MNPRDWDMIHTALAKEHSEGGHNGIIYASCPHCREEDNSEGGGDGGGEPLAAKPSPTRPKRPQLAEPPKEEKELCGSRSPSR